MTRFNSIEFKEDQLVIIDQTKLPLEEVYIKTDDYERIAVAIERLEVRGAPAIGIAAAYALALGIKKHSEKHFNIILERLASTRPTAVNLFWALDRLNTVYAAHKNSGNLFDLLLDEAKAIHVQDIDMCDKIAINGYPIFKKKSTVLTHCNTGQLATGGGGTAFNIIRYAHKMGMVKHVFADETRPLLQGSRLTAFELSKAEIPFSINTDSTAAFLMKQGKIDLVITGSDRIALNGDAANKIGTYNLAVLCRFHNIPFYIAAPTSTIDSKCRSGDEINIEYRKKEEINSIRNTQITSQEYEVFSPAFDVTPNNLITGIVTELDLYNPPFNFSNF